MSDDFERELRGALRPVDPPAGFAERVLANVQPRRRWQPSAFAIAAGLLVVVIVGYQWRAEREREGLEARKQLIEALRLTSEKLDIVYQAVNAPAPPKEPGV